MTVQRSEGTRRRTWTEQRQEHKVCTLSKNRYTYIVLHCSTCTCTTDEYSVGYSIYIHSVIYCLRTTLQENYEMSQAYWRGMAAEGNAWAAVHETSWLWVHTFSTIRLWPARIRSWTLLNGRFQVSICLHLSFSLANMTKVRQSILAAAPYIIASETIDFQSKCFAIHCSQGPGPFSRGHGQRCL